MSKKDKKDYTSVGNEILLLLGGQQNLKTINNCITRLRVTLNDKSLIDEKKLKDLPITKGINWNGDEFQIIIGGEVSKVRSAVDFIIKGKVQKDTNSSIIKRCLSVLSGVVTPVIPVLIVSGLLYGLQSLLSLTGAINVPGEGQTLGDVDPLSALIIASSGVGLQVLGVFFSWSIARYFNGNQTMAILIALTISTHQLLGGGYPGINGNLVNDGNGWKLFEIAGQGVYFKSVYGTILPFVGATAFYLWFDSFVKKWMPMSVDAIFRPFLTFVLTVSLSFFLFSPILGIIEQLVGIGAAYLLEIPFGIGSGLLALLMQPIVLLGAHLALFAVFSGTLADGQETLYVTAVRVAEFAQFGALLAVIIRTKSFKTRKEGLSFLFPAALGITEPVIYGINLQKGKPIIFGCIGGGIAGMLAGILNLPSLLGGFGILGVLGFSDPIKMSLFLLVDFIGMGIALALTLVFYQERPSEIKNVAKLNKQFFKIVNKSLETKIKYSEWDYSQKLDALTSSLNENKSFYKEYEDALSKKVKLQETYNTLIERDKNKKAVEIEPYLNETIVLVNTLKPKYNEINQKFIDEYSLILNNIKEIDQAKIKNNLEYWLNSIEINYDNKQITLIK